MQCIWWGHEKATGKFIWTNKRKWILPSSLHRKMGSSSYNVQNLGFLMILWIFMFLNNQRKVSETIKITVLLQIHKNIFNYSYCSRNSITRSSRADLQATVYEQTKARFPPSLHVSLPQWNLAEIHKLVLWYFYQTLFPSFITSRATNSSSLKTCSIKAIFIASNILNALKLTWTSGLKWKTGFWFFEFLCSGFVLLKKKKTKELKKKSL